MKKIVLSILISSFIFGASACSTSGVSSGGSEQDVEIREAAPAKSSELQENTAKTASGAQEFQGAKDPQTAIAQFIEAMKTKDMDQIERVFVVQEFIDHYDKSSEYAEQVPRPTATSRRVEVFGQVGMFVFGTNYSFEELVDENDEAKTMKRLEELRNKEFDTLLAAADYSTLEVLRVDLPEKDEAEHEKRIDREVIETKLYGAQGWEYRTALLSLDGNTYYCGFRFAKYDGCYKIVSLSCPVIPMPAEYAALECSEEDYIGMIDHMNE